MRGSIRTGGPCAQFAPAIVLRLFRRKRVLLSFEPEAEPVDLALGGRKLFRNAAEDVDAGGIVDEFHGDVVPLAAGDAFPCRDGGDRVVVGEGLLQERRDALLRVEADGVAPPQLSTFLEDPAGAQAKLSGMFRADTRRLSSSRSESASGRRRASRSTRSCCGTHREPAAHVTAQPTAAGISIRCAAFASGRTAIACLDRGPGRHASRS
jgi:hypothetical protein